MVVKNQTREGWSLKHRPELLPANRIAGICNFLSPVLNKTEDFYLQIDGDKINSLFQDGLIDETSKRNLEIKQEFRELLSNGKTWDEAINELSENIYCGKILSPGRLRRIIATETRTLRIWIKQGFAVEFPIVWVE
ncbi:MAG TPA: hypothetical protein VMW10_03160 [Alphaproteobacteria bacterium]|nr:hypothetical protein [Alphaproteobacteria bacterium]